MKNLLPPTHICKRCEYQVATRDGLCEECYRIMHSKEEAQNYNATVFSSPDEYREVGL